MTPRTSVLYASPFLWFTVLALAGCNGEQRLQSESISTAYAPSVPPPVTRTKPDTVRASLNATIHDIALAEGVLYHAWTFNDHVPGPFIRARVGDILEVRVTNSDTTGMLHNIDFHAVTGPGGGGDLTNVSRGQERIAWFRLLHPGLFVYHCAARPMTAHIANGMYGLMLVEPEHGLPAVAHEYYVMQSEFYTTPPRKDSAYVDYSPENGLREDPQYVLFNGDYAALLGPRALKASTGESVRIYFGNIGPNKVSSFHIVGAVFDKLYREGDLVSEPARSVSVTAIPAGGAAVVELTPEVPGIYTLLDHSIFRTEKGAMGQLAVSGQPRPDIYNGR
jgi:copper-containing nitrite reductase